MTAPSLPPMAPLIGGPAPPAAEITPDALDVEDAQAGTMHRFRSRWIVAAMNAGLTQVAAEVEHHRLVVNVESIEVKVTMCGAAAAAVTAAQLVSAAQHNAAMRAMQPIFDDIQARLTAIEAREKMLVELAAKMDGMLKSFEVPTPEEFARIMGSATAKDKTWRKLVPREDGDGLREESDAELRARLAATMPSEARRARATAPPDSPETVERLAAKVVKTED